MGLLILLGSGAVLGWLAALVSGAADSRAAWLRVSIGAGTTVLSGLMVSDGPMIETLGARALVLAISSGLAVLALVTLIGPFARR